MSSSGDTLTINVPSLDDADPDPTNEIQVVDSFLIVTDSLLIALSDDGVPPSLVDLSPYLDNTDNQTLSWNSPTRFLTISGGNSVFLDVMQDWDIKGDIGFTETVTHGELVDIQGGLGMISTSGSINVVSKGWIVTGKHI